MSFLDEAQREQAGKARPGSRCLMCTLIEDWGDEGNELAVVLADPAFYASTIIEVLKQRGVDATPSQVGNHRRQHVPGWRDSE